MTDRARLSKLPDYTSSSPPGATFLNSPSFPTSLLTTLEKSDPRSILFSSSPIPSPTSSSLPSSSQQSQLKPLLTSRLANKQILVCSGGVDKLVPYACSKPFLDFLKEATDVEKGWWKEGGCRVDDRVYEGVGHAFSEGMRRDTVVFVRGVLEGEEKRGSSKL